MDARRAALLRLGGLTTGLVALFAVFALGGVLDRQQIDDWIDPLGVAAPLAYVLIGGVLGALLVPGAVLAAAAGLLFGAVAGALVSLPSAVLTAVLARSISARTGGDALDVVAGERLAAVTSFARRHGFSAVVVQRLMPVAPDGPFSHAFGLAGVRTRDIALATLLASGPRAFSYALLGANADDLTGPDALFAIALNVTTGIVGLTLAWIVVRNERARGRRLRAAEHAAATGTRAAGGAGAATAVDAATSRDGATGADATTGTGAATGADAATTGPSRDPG